MKGWCVTYHFSVKGQGHTGRSNFYSLVDYWSTISSYCWRKDCFWPSMNVCIYCLNVPCCEILFNQNYLRYYIFFKIWPWKGHIVGPTSYRLASISFLVSWHSHSWDMAISKSDLENPRSKARLEVKVQGHTVGLASIWWPSILFHVNRPAIDKIWPIGCSTQCHQYGRQTFSMQYIFIFIMWSLKGINSFKVPQFLVGTDKYFVSWFDSRPGPDTTTHVRYSRCKGTECPVVPQSICQYLNIITFCTSECTEQPVITMVAIDLANLGTRSSATATFKMC